MYIPNTFTQNDYKVVRRLVAEQPLGALVALTSHGLDAHHLPFILQEGATPHGTLHGHVARANPIWRDFDARFGAMVIFKGADHFVSPGWYPAKQVDGRVVPTWNFAVAHLHGSMRFIDDPAWLRVHLEELTALHETGRPKPWRIDDAPADFIEQMLGALVGLEIVVERIEAKWKASQNQAVTERDGVIQGLLRENTHSAAAMVRLVWETDPRRCPLDAEQS